MSIPLLRYISTTSIPRIEGFVVNEKFQMGNNIDGIVVDGVGAHFTENFLDNKEEPTPEIILVENELQVSVQDGAILPLLGENSHITLGQLWSYLQTANRAFWYVGYIHGKGGTLCGVHAGWMQRGGLYVESGPLNRGHGWGIGSHFLTSHNPPL